MQTLQAAMEAYYNNAQTPHTYIVTSTTPCGTYFMTQTPAIISNAIYDPFAPVGVEYDAVVSSNGLYYAFGSIGTGTTLSGFTINTIGAVTHATGNICLTNGTGC